MGARPHPVDCAFDPSSEHLETATIIDDAWKTDQDWSALSIWCMHGVKETGRYKQRIKERRSERPRRLQHPAN